MTHSYIIAEMHRALLSVETFSHQAARFAEQGTGDDEWLLNLRLAISAASANMAVAKALLGCVEPTT